MRRRSKQANWPGALTCMCTCQPEGFLRTLGPVMDSLERYFRTEVRPRSLEDIIAEFEGAGVEKMVALPIEARAVTGEPGNTNEYMAEVQNKFPDKIMAFATVNPLEPKAAVEELVRAVRDLGLKGLKLHPQLQAFYPNDPRMLQVYEKSQELDIPIVIHAGVTGIGAGMPGGAGIRLDYSRPIYVDEVAASFPDLRVVCSHFEWPWVEELLAIALHKGNVFIDLSGWAPKYFPEVVVRYMNSLLQDKFMFGSDYPMLSPRRWLWEFEQLPLKSEVKSKVLYENAQKLLAQEA